MRLGTRLDTLGTNTATESLFALSCRMRRMRRESRFHVCCRWFPQTELPR